MRRLDRRGTTQPRQSLAFPYGLTALEAGARLAALVKEAADLPPPDIAQIEKVGAGAPMRAKAPPRPHSVARKARKDSVA